VFLVSRAAVRPMMRQRGGRIINMTSIAGLGGNQKLHPDFGGNGEYGIPKDVMFGYPVTCEGGKYKIVEGLAIDEFSRGCIDKTLAELTGEQDGVKHLL